jgi:hypothetical protein
LVPALDAALNRVLPPELNRLIADYSFVSQTLQWTA